MSEMKVDLNGRPMALRPIDWEALMAPKTVAVVGATDTEGTQQRAQWVQVHERLSARGATVVPVHPTKPDILGTKAYASITEVPFHVDLAIVLVREPLPVLEECLR
jgi:predicted CoA-binding protein